MSPDQTGTGALPLCRANASFERKRAMPAVSPTILAAVSGPQPGRARRVNASDRTRASISRSSCLDRDRQLADPGQELTGEPGNRLAPPGERRLEPGLDDQPAKGPRGWLGDGELDEVPAQALLVAGPLADQVFAVVDEQANVAVGTIERGDWQTWLAEHRLGDGEGVDRVALARLTERAPRPRHQLGRDADNRLTSSEEVGLQPA